MPASLSRQHLGLRISPVGCYTLLGSLTSPYKAGFLTSASSLPFPFSYYVQWDNEKSLLCYSDRIAQDLHLIPSPDCYADNNLHFICSIWNYTDIIVTLPFSDVNHFQQICHFFIKHSILFTHFTATWSKSIPNHLRWWDFAIIHGKTPRGILPVNSNH